MFVAAVLLAVAQPIVGPEIRSAPFTTYGAPAGPHPALGLTGNGEGFVICWAAVAASGHSRILISRLNAEAATTSTSELPTLDSNADAFAPAIAGDGKRFLVTWTEIAYSEPQGVVAVAKIDRDLNVAMAPRRLTDGFVNSIAASSGDRDYVSDGQSLWTIDSTGAISISSFFFTIDAFAPGLTSTVTFAGHWWNTFECAHGSLCPCSTSCRYSNYKMDFVVPDVCSMSDGFEDLQLLPAPPFHFPQSGVGAVFDGQQYLIVWPDRNLHLQVTRVTPRCVTGQRAVVIDPTAELSGESNPRAASDGVRSLVVYQTTNDIRAAVIQDGEIGPPFVIASDGHGPALVSVKRGRFLVAYGVASSGGTELAGRFIDFPEPRHRVVK